MKYSIVIVAYKDYASLEKCIASVRSSGIQDYEIIVWDNTPTQLQPEHARESSKKDWGLWLLSKENTGFAKGCNLGAKHAKGEILIFFNPDTQVFGNWADQMAAGLQGDTVAVGPVSNFVAGFQQAQRYGGEDHGFKETLLLIGFCFMIRADIFRELGGMDEKLFLGCDDLDISWRIQLAGYKMAIATGVFVHHEGHTSMNLNPEKDRLIKESSDAMRAKLLDFYGPDVPTSEELWGCNILATQLKRQRLSVCMIVGDRDMGSLQNLLDDIYHLCDEFVMVRTGENLTGNWLSPPKNSQFYNFPWIDDFSAARNFALSKCTGDWVLWLDADDRVSPESAALIDALVHKPGNNVALQACHFAFKVENLGTDGKPYQSFHQPRLFPRLPGIEWGGIGGCHGYVHESYFDKCAKMNLPMVVTNITIQHTGYSDSSVAKAKQDRNLRLLAKEPDNCFKWYNIGTSYMDLHDHDKAMEAFRKALTVSHGEDKGFVDNIRYCLALCFLRKDIAALAIPYLEGNKKPDSLFTLGQVLIDLGKIEEGCDLLWRYLKMGEITDPYGTHYAVFRKNAVETLTQIGVLAV